MGNGEQAGLDAERGRLAVRAVEATEDVTLPRGTRRCTFETAFGRTASWRNYFSASFLAAW